VSTVAQRNYREMCSESLATKFNNTLDTIDVPLAHVSGECIRLWFREFFPRHGISPLQSDYCDHCAGVKQNLDTARRAKQHLLDNSNIDPIFIQLKQNLIDSFNVALKKHAKIAEREQEEYKKCTAASSEIFKDLVS